MSLSVCDKGKRNETGWYGYELATTYCIDSTVSTVLDSMGT